MGQSVPEKRAEIDIGQSLADLVDLLPLAVLISDASCSLVFANRCAVDCFGYSPEELYQRSVSDLFAPKDRPRVAELINRLLERPQPVAESMTMQRADGSTFPAAVCMAAGLTDGQISEVQVVIIDLTQQMADEEKLAKERAFLRQVIDAVPNLIGVKDSNSRFLLANEALAHAYGTTVDDIIGKGDADFNPNEDEVAWFIKDDQEVITQCRPKIIPEEKLTYTDGSVHWLATQKIPLIDEEGRCTRLLLTTHDITAYKRAQEALRRSEQRYRLLYDSMADGFTRSDLTGKLLEVNKTFASMLGYTTEELQGMAYADYTPEKWHAQEIRIIGEQVLTRGYSDPYEKEYRRKDGTIFPVELRTYLLRDENGSPAGYWTIVRDVTERKRVEEEKRAFYRETISSVTGGRLDISGFEELQKYTALAETCSDVTCVEDIPSARQEIEDYCRVNGLYGDTLALFITGVGEAINNAVKHAERGMVCAGSEHNRIWVSVSDQGPGIPGLSLPRATLRRGYSTKISMGMGYTIMLDVSDCVKLATGPEGTTVVLMKNLDHKETGVSLEDYPDTWGEVPNEPAVCEVP